MANYNSAIEEQTGNDCKPEAGTFRPVCGELLISRESAIRHTHAVGN